MTCSNVPFNFCRLEPQPSKVNNILKEQAFKNTIFVKNCNYSTDSTEYYKCCTVDVAFKYFSFQRLLFIFDFSTSNLVQVGDVNIFSSLARTLGLDYTQSFSSYVSYRQVAYRYLYSYSAQLLSSVNL